MTIIAKVDTDQDFKEESEELAICPICKQKLFEVKSLHTNGLIRTKCRRCRKYIRVGVIGEKD